MAGARVLLMALLLGASAGRRLICWQALLQCQDEPDCSYAYNLYSAACAPVLPHRGDPSGRASASSGRRCPSHCISALIQLNQTRRGPALEEGDCAQDASCHATKSAIEPCLPRTGGGGASSAAAAGPRVLGCTEARRRCEQDHRCNAAMGSSLAHCGKLFNGRRCTHECRDVIQDMLTLPKARLLSECVCDGLDRPICEAVKENEILSWSAGARLLEELQVLLCRAPAAYESLAPPLSIVGPSRAFGALGASFGRLFLPSPLPPRGEGRESGRRKAPAPVIGVPPPFSFGFSVVTFMAHPTFLSIAKCSFGGCWSNTNHPMQYQSRKIGHKHPLALKQCLRYSFRENTGHL
ncbi:growth arrest-specific protein 1-like [Ambystoma mexicanum]|uniref:growth arrest-specific protein 1-like n=1 Tax=Ambystoma mexicanum TaxID=8296 RepID=UPI0037E82BE1